MYYSKTNLTRLLSRVAMTLLLALFTTTVWGQNITVKGTVKDAAGQPVISAGVQVQGSTNGVVTDLDGNYSISCPGNATLVFASLGYDTQNILVNGRAVINVVLTENATALEGTVVTALGIRRDAKALGYAATEVNTTDLLTANTVSPVASLQGKVAGVEINQSDGGMFGSTKIQIRGASTLSKNNQPIYVIDGVILDNAVSNTGDADWDSEINDYGNQLKNLNPDDFESLTVLKGAAATALYGSRGLNGAVVITTKSGKGKRGIGVSVSQTVGFDHVFKSPDLQSEYLMGYFPGYIYYGDEYNETGNRWADGMKAYSRNSDGVYSMIQQADYGMGWGPHISTFRGQDVELFDGTIGKFETYPNSYVDAYRLGVNSNTNVSITGGNEKTSFYASSSYKYAQGTTPRNTFDRLSFLLKGSHKITDKLMIEASFNFTTSTPRNAQRNIGEYFAQGSFPAEYDVNRYRHLYKGTHGGLASGSYGDLYRNVPGKGLWWSIYENNREQKETTIRPTVDLTYDVLPWLSLKAGGNMNFYMVRNEIKNPGSGYANEGGYYALSNTLTEQKNAYYGAHVNKRFSDDFEVHGFVRGEYFDQRAQYNGEWTNGGFNIPLQYFIGNSKDQAGFSGYVFDTKRITSIVAAAGFSWKDQIYLDVTGRNDWSSSLVYTNGTGHYSYFYPSVSGSWIASETFAGKLPSWIDFLKFRASWAQVGNDTSPYYVNSGYSLYQSTISSGKLSSLEIPTTAKSSDLKPERKNSWEVGIDWRFFNNRLGLDLTYYKENTTDQIMQISVPAESGINSELINAGNIQNKGFEITLHTVPVETKDWRWDVDFTYTRNDNKIVSLHPDVTNYIVLDGSADYGNYRIASVAKVGGSYGLLMTDSKKALDEDTGLPLLQWSNSWHTTIFKREGVVTELGSMVPDFLGSISTSLRFKNLSLRVLLDARFGGYIASYNSRYALAYGFSGTSMKYRKGIEWTSTLYKDTMGQTFYDGYIPEGVFAKGTTVQNINGSVDVSGMTYQEAYEKGIVEPAHLSTSAYWDNNWGNGTVNDDWVKKLNYIALREVTLGYKLPSYIANAIKAEAMTVSLTGRNLGYLLNTAPNHENPESVRGTGSSNFRMRSYSPYTANYLFTVNITF